MYEIGKIYIWQNLREHSQLNGMETTVLGPMELFEHKNFPGTLRFHYCETDTILSDGRVLYATFGELRPKQNPEGERKVMDQFQPKPELEPA